ncbi:MAG: RNA polymerase sigma factor [Deltaproteobacteria bacterium]|nr:RNA polymerase sigma factor [Deltaproteobacteria bacterium]
MDEHKSINYLKQGDISGLETLVNIYQLRATRAAYLIVRDNHMAEDIVEDAFLRAYERINQFDSNQPFGPWFLRIVVNIAKRVSTQHKRNISLNNVNTNGEIALEDILADLAPSPEEMAEQADLNNTVWTALGKLTPTQRATIVKRYYLGLSLNEIATDLDCPVGTIKWRLHCARERLREWLRPLWKHMRNNKPTA